MKVKKLIKKLGYNVAIHYNEYRGKFEVYQVGTFEPGSTPRNTAKLVSGKKLKKAVKNYIKTF